MLLLLPLIQKAAKHAGHILLPLICLLCILSAATGICVLIVGINLKLKVEEKSVLIRDYDASELPYLLICVGAVVTVTNSVAFQLLYLEAVAKKRLKKAIITSITMAILLFAVVVLAAAILCFVHRGSLRQSFHRGMKKALRSYRDDLSVKQHVDTVQMEFECCGNTRYTDWFDVPWADPKYTDPTERGGSLGGEGSHWADDVPFSCCRTDVMRPCVHHHVTNADQRHQDYDHSKTLTLHEHGCKSALMRYFDTLLLILGGVVMVLFAVQLFIGVTGHVVTVYLETAKPDPNRNRPSEAGGSISESTPLTTDKLGGLGMKAKVTAAKKIAVKSLLR